MASAFTTEAFTLLGVGVVVVALRTAARANVVGVKNFQLDDYLMCVAAVSAHLFILFYSPSTLSFDIVHVTD